MRVAITGAGGFLGTALSERLLAAGLDVLALCRRPPARPGGQWQAYDLAGPVPGAVADADVIVHAAFAMGASSLELERLNCEAAQRLCDTARRHQRHLVFISSMSAHAAAASSYGRAKWQIEQTLDDTRDAIVRPGLIIGPGGLYARMSATLRRAPVVPVFYGGTQPVQPIGLDDLTRGLEQIVGQKLAGTFNLGAPAPITIRELYLRMLAAARLRRPMLPLPGDLTAGMLRLTERLGLSLPLTAENLLGQKRLRSFETAPTFARLGLIPTPLADLPWAPPPPHP